MKLIKVLVKRLNGKLSLSENETLLAQVKFPINFQKQIESIKKKKNNLIIFYLIKIIVKY